MAALANPRVPKRYGVALPSLHSLDLEASTKILEGAIVCKNAAGNGVNATTATALVAVGVARSTVDTAAGDSTVEVESGTFDFANSAAGDAITKADLFTDCFLVDNATVAKTNGTNTRSRAGQVVRLEGGRVYVNINPLAKGA